MTVLDLVNYYSDLNNKMTIVGLDDELIPIGDVEYNAGNSSLILIPDYEIDNNIKASVKDLIKNLEGLEKDSCLSLNDLLYIWKDTVGI